jgi:hypothetical protein
LEPNQRIRHIRPFIVSLEELGNQDLKFDQEAGKREELGNQDLKFDQEAGKWEELGNQD